jgi:hypothetical protein
MEHVKTNYMLLSLSMPTRIAVVRETNLINQLSIRASYQVLTDTATSSGLAYILPYFEDKNRRQFHILKSRKNLLYM